MPKALVIGRSGQDGTLLARLLRQKGYRVIGAGRQQSTTPFAEEEMFCPLDVTSSSQVAKLMSEVQPDEVYYLAAFHRSSEDAPMDVQDLVANNLAVNAAGLNNALGAVASHSPHSRFFHASSSRVFGEPDTYPQNEETPLRPICAYGISKAAGMAICRHYRKTKGVFVSSGILYNHESSLRSPQFVSKKIVRAAVRIARGVQDRLVIGDLNARVDWGYAPDYVQAMWETLQLNDPSEFVIGTGVLHTVRDFVEAAFGDAGLDWQQHVSIDQALLNTGAPRFALCADSSKLRLLAGWKPEVDFQQMVKLMLEEERKSSGSG